MNTITTPARVTRVKASHPKVYDHGDESYNRSAKGNFPMLAAAVCAVALPLMLVSVSALAVYLIKN